MKNTNPAKYTVMPLMCMIALSLLSPTHASAAKKEAVHENDLMQLSLEELMNVTIYTASKREESLFDSPSASYVVTADDIKHSGVTNVADALRLAPGVNVARLDASHFAVSIRGLNGAFTNKLLVMIDGRTVYLEVFSGTLWSEQDVMLEDIKHIEIVRGPGGALWGANAVNGVINIVTKHAKDTQGGLASGRTDTNGDVYGSIRYGGKIGDDEKLYYRIYAKYSDHKAFDNPSGADADQWDSVMGGIRVDYDLGDTRKLFFDLGGFSQDFNRAFNRATAVAPFTAPVTGRSSFAGGSAIAKWTWEQLPGENISFQSFYTHSTRNSANEVNLEEQRFDLQYQQNKQLGENHDVTWGLGFRHDYTKAENSPPIIFTPTNRDTYSYNAFVNDRITLKEDVLDFIVGIKAEYQSLVDWQFQPNAKLLYRPDDTKTFWASIARALRSPSRFERDVTYSTPGSPFTTVGNPTFKSEELIAYEIGARYKAAEHVALDLALFYNDYNDIRHIPATPPLTFTNTLEIESYGAELAFDWQPTSNWQTRASLTALQMDFDYPAGTSTTNGGESLSPHWQSTILSRYAINSEWSISGNLRYVDRIKKTNAVTTVVDQVNAYITADLRLGWTPRDNFEVALVGRNLMSPNRREFISEIHRDATETPRSVYIQAWFKF